MVAGAQPTCSQPKGDTPSRAGDSLPHARLLTSVGQATGHIAAQRGHLLPRNLGPASIIPYQGHHWDLQGEDEAKPQYSAPTGLASQSTSTRQKQPPPQPSPP